MMKITLLKNYRNKETLRVTDMADVVESIRGQEYREQVNELRTMYPVLSLKRNDDGSVRGADRYTESLPRVCFASELQNRNRQRLRLDYTGLVLLEVNNLVSYEEAAAIRSGAAQMPQTLLAFVGASGRSVKIVCRGALVEGGSKKVEGGSKKAEGGSTKVEGGSAKVDGESAKVEGGSLPTTDEDISRFHVNLYEKARLAYNAQLGVTVEKLEPGLERTCYVSIDADATYNPLALPFYVDLSAVQSAVAPVGTSTIEPNETAPGINRFLSLDRIVEFNFSKAYDELADSGEENNEAFNHQLLGLLADYCCETGIPMAIAVSMTRWRAPFRGDRQLVQQVFENAYRRDNEKKYRGRKHIVKPLKNIPPETLLTMKIDIFLRENYELRKNVMRGVAEYRQRMGLGFDFQDLTEEARNSMTMRALEQGIKCWDKDIRRYVNSDDIEHYDPIYDFLEHLPRWDGRDRVGDLAARVKTQYREWPHLFHIWMRSMVAMWQGKGQLTGNALVPLLIGRQGCGKSSFCRILLPREQRLYYNDRINFKNEADLNLGLTSFALINLDEFDKITQRQQIVLKYLVSTSDLKYRPPYGKAYSAHRRYASFIGTTNDQTPLTDPTGNRRFVCVEVDGNIDFQTPVNYPQLYAQLKQEILDGERYWLNKDEEAALMKHNRQYQRLNGLGEMILSLYRRPEDKEADQARWVTLKDIAARLKQSFGNGFKEEPGTLEKIGNFMNRPDYKFESRRKSSGMEYRVVEVG